MPLSDFSGYEILHVGGANLGTQCSLQIRVLLVALEQVFLLLFCPRRNMVSKVDTSGDSAIVIHAATDLDDGEILASYGLAREPDGVISWARDSPQHPRHWSIGRKVYDTALIILLELYT